MGWFVCVFVPVCVISNASPRLWFWKHWPLWCYPQIHLICLGYTEFHTCSLLTRRKIFQSHSKPSCTPPATTPNACSAPGLLLGDREAMQNDTEGIWSILIHAAGFWMCLLSKENQNLVSQDWKRACECTVVLLKSHHVSAELQDVEFCGSLCLKGKP